MKTWIASPLSVILVLSVFPCHATSFFQEETVSDLILSKAELIAETKNREDLYLQFLLAGRAGDESIDEKMMTRFSQGIWKNKLLSEKAMLAAQHALTDSLTIDRRREFLFAIANLYERQHLNNKQLKQQIENYFNELSAVSEDFQTIVNSARKQAERETAIAEKFSTLKIELFTEASASALPHPANQSNTDRKKLLEKEIREAAELLETDEFSKFANRFLSPFGLESARLTTNQLAKSFMYDLALRNSQSYFVKALRSQLESEIRFDLDGRVAWKTNRPEMLWVFSEGAWRIIPISGRRGDAKYANDVKHVDLFQKSGELPIDSEPISDEKLRIESLRVAQKRLLETISSPEKVEHFFQSCICPIYLALMSAEMGQSVDQTIDMFASMQSSPRVQDALKELEKVTRRQLKEDPIWRAEGRVAVFPSGDAQNMIGHNCWRFYEGRWRYDIGP